MEDNITISEVNPRINELCAELHEKEQNLHDTDSLALAQLEGEDMTGYGDIIAFRHSLRADIKALKAEIALLEEQDKPEEERGIIPEWASLIGYFLDLGFLCNHNGKCYEVILPHTAQADWSPAVASTLFKEHRAGRPEWVQPTGAHDAYAKGDEVSHLGKAWVSDIDANVYEPSVYGWTEIPAN